MRFIWDEQKRRINLARHGLDFREAAEMLQGPMLIAQDLREDYGEDRFQGIGFIQNRVAVIIFAEPEADVIRVISLRKATKNEQERIAQDLANRLGPR